MSRQTRASTRLQAPLGNSPRSKRRHNEISYKEPDSDTESYIQDYDDELPVRKIPRTANPAPRRNPSRRLSKIPKSIPAVRPKPRRKPRSRASTSSMSQNGDISTYPGFREIKPLSVAQNLVKEDFKAIEQLLAGPKLPWTTLEYDILLDIFIYGARMLEKDKKSSSNWLINVAMTCKSFHEPAMTALFHSPPLGTPESIRGFLSAIGRPGMSLANKVKHLEIEAIPTLTRNNRSQVPISLEGILAATPNIRSLAVELDGDDPAAKRRVVNFTSKGKANVYKPAMIEIMEANNTYLRSMKWNYFFNLDQQWPWSSLKEVHQSRSMKTIEHLDIVWFNAFTKRCNKDEHIRSLIAGINELPNLKSLSFGLSYLFSTDEDLLASLPKSLEHLTFMDCEDITSEVLASFLITHGQNLRSLELNHNRTLDLGFMGILAGACPRLEILKIDLSCYGLMLTSTDSEPSFQLLLPEDIVPTWPSTLQHIEMSYLRKWGREAATIFFQSLVDAADTLLDLRYLIIKTTVDLDWRDRISFRDKWCAHLQKVFKRHVRAPKKFVRVKRRQDDGMQDTEERLTTSRKRRAIDQPGEESIARRLRRRSGDENDGSAMDQNSSSSRHGSVQQLPGLAETSTSGCELYHVQGRCNIVDIRIENLRPMETQYAERDFMDDEISGDEDWTGQDHFDSYVGGTYAW